MEHTPEQIYFALLKVAEVFGSSVTEVDDFSEGTFGRINHTTKDILLNGKHSVEYKIHGLAHELGHLLLHDKDTIINDIEAEVVAAMVVRTLGLPTLALGWVYVFHYIKKASSNYDVLGYIMESGRIDSAVDKIMDEFWEKISQEELC